MGYSTDSLEYPPKRNAYSSSTRLSDKLSDNWWDTALEMVSATAEKEGIKLVGQAKEQAIDLLKEQLNTSAKSSGTTAPTREEIAAELDKSIQRKNDGVSNPDMSFVNKFKSGLTKSVKELKSTSPFVTGGLGFAVGKLLGLSNLTSGGIGIGGAVAQRIANDRM